MIILVTRTLNKAEGCIVDVAVMLEAAADNVSQADFQKCIKEGVKHTQPIVDAIRKLQQEYGKPKRELTAPPDALSADILEVLSR